MSDIVFMDTETLGVHVDAPIWEFAAIRRVSLGGELAAEKSLHIQIHHYADPWLTGDDPLPEQFQADYRARFVHRDAVGQSEAAQRIADFLEGRPHIVGAVPNFDTERIARQLLRPAHIPEPWHYHLIDIENVIVGFLRAAYREDGSPREQIDRLTTLPWSSDLLSAAVGVDPAQFDRHTAMGDVLWVKAQWDAVMGERP